MPKSNLMIRKDRIRYGFVPQIKFRRERELVKEDIEELDIMFNEDLVILDTEDLVEVIEKEEDNTNPTYYKFIDELQGIRRNAKRQLELWIRRNKVEIKGFTDEDRTNLMLFIEDRYFNKK
jgi:hypothetical protein